VYGIFQYAVSFPRFVSKTVVPMDASRQIAGWMGQGVSSLLPPTPEDVAKVLGFPTNKKACQTLARFGAVADGGKGVCLDHFSTKNCVVFSFGVNFEFSFDRALTMMGCKVHAFDPFMMRRFENAPSHIKEAAKVKLIPRMIDFQEIGLGERDIEKSEGSAKLRTLFSLAQTLGYDELEILKIDIEGDEWIVLEQVAADLQKINVKQICIEIHLDESLVTPERVKELIGLLYEGGYELWLRSDNVEHSKIIPWSGYHVRFAYELSFVKVSTRGID